MPRVKKEVPVKTTKVTVKKAQGLSVPSYTMAGAESGTLSLPEDLFGAKVNKNLLAQATRVYLNNQKSHSANTKTRGEVKGSTAKMGPQKGSGHARHGSKRAPIFRGGGIALGPKFRKVILELPKKMKKAALIAALSQKVKDGSLLGISGIEDVSGKTQQMQLFYKKLAKNNLLLVTDKTSEKLQRAVSNLARVDTVTCDQPNILEILKSHTLMFTKDAVEKLAGRIKKEDK